MKPMRLEARSRVPMEPRSAALARSKVYVGTFIELYRALVESGRWWMVPMVIVLGFTALLLVVVSAVEYVAPFVYTIF